MKKKVIILQHVASENAGTILDFLKRKKIPSQQVNLYAKKPKFPDINKARALIVMGGPMNVYEEEKFPFLKPENTYIQEAILRGVPYLGVCLGSQLLAKAMGAKVYKAKKEEIGWDTVDLTARAKDDPFFKGHRSSTLKVLQWHGDTFDLPRGSVHLAANKDVPHQAYCVAGLFYGLQFHIEVNRPMLESWFKRRSDLPQILKEYDRYKGQLKKITDKFYSNFFSL
jgi:GMP synthase-like glutamine amidotransferase